MAAVKMSELEALKEAYPDAIELEQVLGQLPDVALSRHRLRLERHKRDLREFEQRYGMGYSSFYQPFEGAELGAQWISSNGPVSTSYVWTFRRRSAA